MEGTQSKAPVIVEDGMEPETVAYLRKEGAYESEIPPPLPRPNLGQTLPNEKSSLPNLGKTGW